MPIRWYGPADPTDPTYRHFARIVNLVLHAMVFAAVNSGLWFVQEMRHPWSRLPLVSLVWGLVLAIHLTVVLVQRPSKAETPEPPSTP